MFSFTGHVLSEKDRKKGLPPVFTKFYAIENTVELARVKVLLNTDIVGGEIVPDSQEYSVLNKDWN